MEKLSSFLLDVNRWKGSKLYKGLSKKEMLIIKGAYIDLLVEQADNDYVTLDDVKEICGDQFDFIWPILSKKFPGKNNVFRNIVQKSVLARRKRYCESRRANRLSQNKKQKDMCADISSTYDYHMHSHSHLSSLNNNHKVKEKKEGYIRGKGTENEKINFSGVFLTQGEYDSLIKDHGKSNTYKILEKLSNHKLAKGIEYKSDLGAINLWVIDALKEKKQYISAAETTTPDEEIFK